MTVSQYMWNLMLNDEKFAYEFADRAHCSVNQLRKYNKMPYIEHPVRVAETVLYYQGTSEMVQAALLHDVVEDTGITSETIHKMFGPKVGELVDWLTDISNSLAKMASTALLALPSSGAVRSQILRAPFSIAAFSTFAPGTTRSDSSFRSDISVMIASRVNVGAAMLLR